MIFMVFVFILARCSSDAWTAEVEERLIFAAAIAGIKAFEAEGGLAWVYLQPKIMKLLGTLGLGVFVAARGLVCS